MGTLIKEVSTSSSGLVLKLTRKAALNGGISTDTWFVSWDRLGKALFGEQYSDERATEPTLNPTTQEVE